MLLFGIYYRFALCLNFSIESYIAFIPYLC